MEGGWESYIVGVEKRFARAGICKIIPPAGWKARKGGYDDMDGTNIIIPKAIKQSASGRNGILRYTLLEQRPMSLSDFQKLAKAPHNQAPKKELDALHTLEGRNAMERRYWKSVATLNPIYGADVPGSLFDPDVKQWNVAKLDSLLTRVLEKSGKKLPGVNTPYLYFGMFRATFAWHTEDLDLHSVNFLHYGAPKVWYCIAPEDRLKFERAAANAPELQALFRDCPQFFRHKLLISPTQLAALGVPVRRLVQYPGEFVINYPGAYHSGFNAGYNCAESTNFATPTWIEIGAIARTCYCRDDCVRIDLRLFLDVSWVCSRSHIYAADQCAGNVLACLLPAGGV
eukprot:jgi/Astpho2/4705/e_gw1.00067.210.1_t